jgi:hypothetical protein
MSWRFEIAPVHESFVGNKHGAKRDDDALKKPNHEDLHKYLINCLHLIYIVIQINV